MKRPGRPKSKSPLRNFKLKQTADETLIKEAARTGRSQTGLIEDLLHYVRALQPPARDLVYSAHRPIDYP